MPVSVAVTAMPVLAGDAAGVTATVSKVVAPEASEAGVAAPVPKSEPALPPTLELRGVGGEAIEKSAELLFVLREETVRMMDWVLVFVVLGPGAAAVPLKQLAVLPKPT